MTPGKDRPTEGGAVAGGEGRALLLGCSHVYPPFLRVFILLCRAVPCRAEWKQPREEWPLALLAPSGACGSLLRQVRAVRLTPHCGVLSGLGALFSVVRWEGRACGSD